MKTPIATLILLSPLAMVTMTQGQTTTTSKKATAGRTGVATAPPARALTPTPASRGGTVPPKSGGTASAAKSDPKVVLTNNEATPELTPMEELEKPKIPLPTAPIGPYLLQKEHGPFMVMAHSFRGPDASKYAQALCIELKQRYGLPAYIWHAKIQPGHSNIRNIAPTAPTEIPGNRVTEPEGRRMYDEAAVLVGNCATLKESQALWYRVKKLHSNTLDGLPSIYPWRKKGLSRALMATNPLRASQELFPGSIAVPMTQGGSIDMEVVGAALQNAPKKPDAMLVQMNQGRLSLLKCQGEWVLQVAEFTGRSVISNGTAQSDGKTFDPHAVKTAFGGDSFFKKSLLAQAADDAEGMAEGLSKSKKLGSLKPYVYHDRFSSKVYLGPFTSPTDPALAKLFRQGHRMPGLTDSKEIRLIDEISTEMLKGKKSKMPLLPSGELTRVPRQ